MLSVCGNMLLFINLHFKSLTLLLTISICMIVAILTLAVLVMPFVEIDNCFVVN